MYYVSTKGGGGFSEDKGFQNFPSNFEIQNLRPKFWKFCKILKIPKIFLEKFWLQKIQNFTEKFWKFWNFESKILLENFENYENKKK